MKTSDIPFMAKESKDLDKMAMELVKAGYKVSVPLKDVRATFLVDEDLLATFKKTAHERGQKIKHAMSEAIKLYLENKPK